MKANVFLRSWDWAGRWALVALRPGELPPRPDPSRYVEAVASFEQVAGADAALPAWRAGLLRWPGDARLYLALGNQAYDRGELAVAISFYRRGLRAAAQDPALSNNLASVLAETGCPRTGIELLQPVADTLADDSQWRGVIGATLAELAAAGQGDPDNCAVLMPAQVNGATRKSRWAM
jgi:predicted Zn-dependent protease